MKPLQLCIFSGFVAGVKEYKPDLNKMKVGDVVEIRPDPQNPWDPTAIELWCNGMKLGFIPRISTFPIHLVLQNELTPAAYVSALDPIAKLWESILVRIFVEVNR